MNAPATATAYFTGVSVTVPSGVQFTLNGTTYTGSKMVGLAPGTYTLSTTIPQSTGVGTQAVFANWSDGGAISHSFTVGNTPLSITGTFAVPTFPVTVNVPSGVSFTLNSISR